MVVVRVAMVAIHARPERPTSMQRVAISRDDVRFAGLLVLQVQGQHVVLVDRGAHGFWYRVCDAMRLHVNVHLSSGSPSGATSRAQGVHPELCC